MFPRQFSHTLSEKVREGPPISCEKQTCKVPSVYTKPLYTIVLFKKTNPRSLFSGLLWITLLFLFIYTRPYNSHVVPLPTTKNHLGSVRLAWTREKRACHAMTSSLFAKMWAMRTLIDDDPKREALPSQWPCFSNFLWIIITQKGKMDTSLRLFNLLKNQTWHFYISTTKKSSNLVFQTTS